MSLLELAAGTAVPEFDLADRLRKAARHADLSNSYIAATLHVSESTISGWLNGQHKPPKMSQILFASLCGVDPNWLQYGTPGTPEPAPGLPAPRRHTRAKRVNRRPVDYMPGAISANLARAAA